MLDGSGELLANLKLMRNADKKIALDEAGNQIMLTSPEGVFVHEKNRGLYIADTGAQWILVLDLDTYALKRMITQPENLTGATQFKPSKLAVDLADRIYVIVQSSYEGIIELTADGSFSGYYGVNTPRVSLIDYFWKSLASDEQKEQMSKTYAPAFNNIALDGEGFIMAVTYDTSAEDMVFRLNSNGKNVLREEGSSVVIGELWNLHSDDKGSRCYYNGRWDDALVHFEQAVKLNVNYDVAYSGIGKNYLMKSEYKKAMEYFKLGQNRIFYSKAYNGYRSEMLEKYFPVVMIIFTLLISWMIFTEIRYHRKGGKKA